MSIYLCGGGDVDLVPFVEDAAARAALRNAEAPRIAVITVDQGEEHIYADELISALEEAGDCDTVSLSYGNDDDADLADLVDIDAVFVGGGPTVEYLRVLAPIVGEIRRRVAEGMPYFGVSAGALAAAERAFVRGHAIGGVAVAPDMIGEGADEIELDSGIGLIDVTVDVHAAQWGALGRLIAATEAGMASGGVAIDENTALVVAEGGLHVIGTGTVWQVIPADHGVSVSTMAAES